MRLYVNPCKSCNSKIYLDVKASNRSELRHILGDKFYLNCPNCHFSNQFNISQVQAESEVNSALAGGIVGGLIGLIGGPIGLFLGGAIGAALGDSSDEEERKRVEFFNGSF